MLMNKLDIKRLHEVHKHYPHNSRGVGKTTYCYDSLLRATQTLEYDKLLYITNTRKSAFESFEKFKMFLNNLGEKFYQYDQNKLELNGCKIIFSEKWDSYLNPSQSDGVIEDLW